MTGFFDMNPPGPRPPKHFQVYEGYACYAPAGVVSLDMASNLIASAILFAREQKIRRLLVDATQLTGFHSPSVAERYWIARKWAKESKNMVEAAFALQRYLIDPERFGVQVAINLGMRADVFESSSDALSWLLSGARPYPLANKIY
jgi:hypothetical protein